MGAGDLKDLRDRIDSVNNTKQVTHAMEMIAASRIQRARRRVEESRPYAEMIEEIIRGLMASTEAAEHPLLQPHDSIDAVAVCTVNSDRGLAGAYNANIYRAAQNLFSDERDEGNDIYLYPIGEKGVRYFQFQGFEPDRTWTGFSERPDIADAELIADALMEGYREERFDRVWVVYTEFHDRMRQSVQRLQLLPVDVEDLEGGEEMPAEFMFEPDPEEILERLIPRYVEANLFYALLSAAASEHAMRQRAMRQATENAEEMVDDLERELNRARQQQITQEITQISAGAEALSES